MIVDWWDPRWGPAPRYATRRRPERKTYGAAVAKIARPLGKPLFPWQRYVVDVGLEVDPATGGLFYDEVIVFVVRRAGKTVLIDPLVTWTCGRPKINRQAWLTAQKLDSAVARWRASSDVIMDKIGKPTVDRHIANTREQLFWPGTGSKFVPFGPDAKSMHGEDPDLVIVDELWSFDRDQQRAIEAGYEPARSVKAGQVWKLSAAGNAKSDWLKTDRLRGRAAAESGGDHRIAFFEWCIPEEVDGVPVRQLDDESLFRLILNNHPRRDHGLRPEVIMSAIEKDRPAATRAYGGLDESDVAEEGSIPNQVLADAMTRDLIPGDVPVVLAVAVDDDRRECSVSAFWRDASGVARVELLKRAAGTRWLVGYVDERCGRNEVRGVGVLRAGASRDICDELERVPGLPVVPISQTDLPAACNRFADELEALTILHMGEAAFETAVRASDWRKSGSGGRIFVPQGDAPITPLTSHALSAWTWDHSPEIEQQKPYSWAAY